MRELVGKIGLLICFVVGFNSCAKKIESIEDFNAHINAENSGLKVSRSVNGVKISVIFTPPEYITMREMELNGFTGKSKYDSLLNNNQSSASFLMVFGPDETKGSDDIMLKGLKNYKEYVERAMTLNFDLEQQITLSTEKGDYEPVLSSLENTYGLSKDRKVNIVFSSADGKDLFNAKKYDFTYSDEIYDVGILHFEFDKEKINGELPQVVFPIK